MPSFDTMSDVPIEQPDAFEQLAGYAAHHRLDIGAEHRVGHEKRQIELRRRRCG